MDRRSFLKAMVKTAPVALVIPAVSLAQSAAVEPFKDGEIITADRLNRALGIASRAADRLIKEDK